MTERPILFSGPMVRALLEGRKTQTRRIVKPQPPSGFDRVAPEPPGYGFQWQNDAPPLGMWTVRCPYGVPGDRLWVRETFSFVGGQGVWELSQAQSLGVERWLYRAGGDDADRWWPSIHMPRFASRLTLEVTGVRVERVQDISRVDAKAEGFLPSEGNGLESWNGQSYGNAQLAFAACWKDINGVKSWDANPWVWVLTFEVLQ